jgi:hypothetical protein
MGENVFEFNLPPLLELHLAYNVELLPPYFLPLLDSLEVTGKLDTIELNCECKLIMD